MPLYAPPVTRYALRVPLDLSGAFDLSLSTVFAPSFRVRIR